MLEGNPGQWLLYFRSLEERIAEAVEAAWPLCIGPLRLKKARMTHEDHITNHLISALIKTKRVPGRIIPQYTLLETAADQSVRVSSNIDFVVTIGDDEDVYLACECKRLNVPYKSGKKALVGEYVKDGIMRFIQGQYANGLPLAMMLGYVMDARLEHARRGLRRAMTVRARSINLQETRDSAVVAGRPLRFVTAHRCLGGDEIEISHTLLGWP
jgi:hypothetical protein